MKWLAEVFLICGVVVSSSRSSEDARLTLETETAPTTMLNTLISTSMITATPATITTEQMSEDEKHKSTQLPVDLLSEDKVLLDPNVVLARVVRDTRGDTYGGWAGYRQSFSKPYERKPFGIQGYYDLERAAAARPVSLKRRNDVRRSQLAPRRFRIYPVFPG